MVPEQPVASQSKDSDEYELVPRSQLEYLQKEVEKLKKNPFGDSGSAKDMLSGVDSLNKNVARLISVFETANDEIVRDYKDKANTEKINMVLEQNEKLAKGIVAIADLLRELKEVRGDMWLAAPPGAAAAPVPQGQEQQQPFSSASLSPEWQSVIGAPQQGAGAFGQQLNANPFLDQQQAPGQAPPPHSFPAFDQGPQPQQWQQATPQPQPQFGAPAGQPPQPQAQRRLPPIDFSAVPPPPRR